MFSYLKNTSNSHIIRYGLLLLTVFSIILSIFPNLVETMHRVPINNVLITFDKYQDIPNHTYINYPHIEGIHDSSIENKINTIIDDTIFHFLKDQNQDAFSRQYISSYIDYSLYYVDNKMISFSIKNLQIMASSYTKTYYFTIDINTGNLYQVEDFLGSKYQEDIKRQVLAMAKQKMKEERNNLYFIDTLSALIITSTQPFYINKKGRVVICFDKYQIAPGCMGIPEFIIERR